MLADQRYPTVSDLDRIERLSMNAESIFLLVEDNEDDVFFMERAFRQAGMHNPLHVVHNGEEAINYLSGQNGFANREQYPLPDMVFLDLKMPGVNGFEVLKWMREQHLNMPVAVLTSSPEEIDRKRAKELGADCYLLKPPTKEMILSCCRQFELTCA
jgi:CheY-like chemotaxis protein